MVCKAYEILVLRGVERKLWCFFVFIVHTEAIDISSHKVGNLQSDR
jgi:hypothetical protein